MFQYDFRRITSRAALIDALGTDDATFEAVIGFVPQAMTSTPIIDSNTIVKISIPMFIRHDIPKRNKSRGYRTVWEPIVPMPEYKALARRLGSFFRMQFSQFPHDCAYGYRSGRNIRENAAAHTGHRFLLSLDLHDFFHSIRQEDVVNFFISTGINSEVSALLGKYVTISDVLPLGLPTSPVISNAIMLPVDAELKKIADGAGATYTRYVDDLSFSSNNGLPEVDQIRDVLLSHGFRLAETKTHHSKIGQAHYVTGLSISDHIRPHVPRKTKHLLRQELYYIDKFGIENHYVRIGVNDKGVIQEKINRLDGLIKFVAHHEPKLSAKLKTKWNEILLKNHAKPSFSPRKQHRPPFTIFIDEAEYEKDGLKILAVCMVVSEHGDQILLESAEVLDAALTDLWADGNFDSIKKRGLHFADATEDLRLAYVKRLASMRFGGYVALDTYKQPSDYASTYIKLINKLISRRLMAAESKFLYIAIEQNSKISSSSVTECIQNSFDELKSRNDRRPLAISIDFVSKPHLGVSAPDFLLGVLGKYLQSNPAKPGSPEPRQRLTFERLRDKYRLIIDLSIGVEYSRRRPISPWKK